MILDLKTPENRIKFAEILIKNGFKNITPKVYNKTYPTRILPDIKDNDSKFYFKKGRFEIIWNCTIQILDDARQVFHDGKISLSELSIITKTFFFTKDYIYTKKPNKVMPECWDKCKISYIDEPYKIVWFNSTDEKITGRGGCGLHEFPKCYSL